MAQRTKKTTVAKKTEQEQLELDQEQDLEQEQPKELTFNEEVEAFREEFRAFYERAVKLQRKARKENVPSTGRLIQFEKSLLRNGRNLRISLPSKFDIK